MSTPNLLAFTRRSLLAAAILTVVHVPLHAAVVTWGTPTAISGDADVSTTGTLFGAYNVGDSGVSSTTVNGVTFQSFAVPLGNTSATAGSSTLAAAGAGIFISDNVSYGSASTPFSNLSSSYQTLLSSGVFTAPSSFDLTIVGLTIGQAYEFQWWANTSGPAGLGVSTLHEAVAGNSVTLDDNPSLVEGGVGQFVKGTFVADGTSQTITFNPAGSGAVSAQVNAFQVREVPEPSSVGLLGIALLSIGAWARFRNNH